MRRSVFAVPLLLWAVAAWGAGPYITDDAAIAAPGTCQVEAWSRWYRAHGYDRVALPACNTVDRVEATLGLSRHEDRSGAGSQYLLLQGKSIFREFGANALGFGAVAGGTWRTDPAPGERRFSQGYAYVPLTALIGPAGAQLHVNLGVLHSEDLRRQFATWAVGAESALTERLALNLEFFGDHRQDPSTQAGITFYLIPDRLTLFALPGAQHDSGDASWATLGVAVSGPLFRP